MIKYIDYKMKHIKNFMGVKMYDLTILSIENKENYICRGNHSALNMARFIRKKHLKSYTEAEKEAYIKDFCQKKNTIIVVHLIKGREIKDA